MKFSIYDFYDIVFGRPGMFIGEHSISKIETYLSGADLALTYQRFYENHEGGMPANESQEFNAWLNERIGSDCFYNACVYLKSKFGTEERALDELINLYKEFRGPKFGKILKQNS